MLKNPNPNINVTHCAVWRIVLNKLVECQRRIEKRGLGVWRRWGSSSVRADCHSHQAFVMAAVLCAAKLQVQNHSFVLQLGGGTKRTTPSLNVVLQFENNGGRPRRNVTKEPISTNCFAKQNANYTLETASTQTSEEASSDAQAMRNTKGLNSLRKAMHAGKLRMRNSMQSCPASTCETATAEQAEESAVFCAGATKTPLCLGRRLKKEVALAKRALLF